LPDNEKYGIVSQIKRAAVSIPSNISEGCSRNGSDDFKRFLEIALGSAFELETQIIIIKDVFKINAEDANIILNELQKSINSLITIIKSSNANSLKH
jgi:four helix bundle protein